MTASSCASIEPLASAVAQVDPYPTYHQWRSAGPLHWNPAYFGGAWVLTTFQGVKDALRDSRLSARRTGGWVMRNAARGSPQRKEWLQLQRIFARAMLFVDKPDHPRLRQAMQAGFRPTVIQSLQPYVTQTIQDLLDDIERRASLGEVVDFIEDFARLLPARIVSHLLGLKGVDPALFLAWSADLADFLGSALPSDEAIARAQSSLVAMSECLASMLQRPSELEPHSLMAVLARAEKAGTIHQGAEMLAQCTMLLFAGQETTRHLLGLGMLSMLRQPGLWSAVRFNPSLLPGAVRELLRWDSPVQYTGRRATTDMVLFGQQIRRGQLVLPLIGAANRDPLEYRQPDEFRVDRALGMPLSFGFGPHVCIGASLTLMEAEAAFGAILQRWPDARLAGEAEWIASPLYRGLTRLPLQLGSAG